MKSKRNGDAGERLVAEALRERGYWVHLTQRNRMGQQPVDVIAAKGGCFLLMDAKYISEERASFPFSDIAPDQETCLGYAKSKGIKGLGFALCFARDLANIRFLGYDDYERLAKEGKKSVNMETLETLQSALEELENDN